MNNILGEKETFQNNIMYIIINFMKDAQSLGGNGDDKKLIVLKNIRFFLGDDTYHRFEPLLELLINTLKLVANNKQILNGLQSATTNCLKLCR